MKRFNNLDYLNLELCTQWNRLKYSWVTSQGKSYCSFPPRKIAVEVSSFCNLRCIHCAHGASPDGTVRMNRSQSMMDFDLFKKVMDEASEFKNSTKIIFALMGEPLLNKRLPDMVAYAHSKGLWTQVNTNCTLLSREKGEALIDAGLDFIYLSLDGITKETYERIRVRSDFDKVINNILSFLELRFEKGAENMIVHVGMTGEIINRSELDIFVEEFSKLPINAVYSPLLFNWNGAIEWVNPELNTLQVESSANYPVCNSSYDICGIQSNGDFIPCIYDHEGKYVSGNVRDHTIMELWNNERTQTFRKSINNRKYTAIEANGHLCSQCTLLWNPHYQVNPSLMGNLKQVYKYTSRAFSDFFNTQDRKKRLYEKYLFLRKHREEFLEGLAKQTIPGESKWFEVAKKEGVLEVSL
jgi:radical SAM protein with 4Fe4S-binding SPASM domain